MPPKDKQATAQPPGMGGTVPTPMTQEQLSALVNSGVAGNLTAGGSSIGASGVINNNSPIYMTSFPIATSTLSRYELQQYQEAEKKQKGGGSGVMTYQEAQMLPRQWLQSDPDKLKQLINTGVLNKVPGFDVGMGIPEIMAAWDKLVQASFTMNQGLKDTDKHYTPFDILNSYSNTKNKWGTVRQGDWLYDVATGAKIKYVGPKSKTTTSRDVNLSSAEDVKALTTQVLTQALGRAPTTDEVAQYRATINAQEQANPTVTTTTQTLNDQGEVSAQSSKTTGGFDAAAQQQLVQDQAVKTPEFAKYQSGTTYWNALMSMLTGG
jgi:hypothetical protein